jgi:hypothetical protein
MGRNSNRNRVPRQKEPVTTPPRQVLPETPQEKPNPFGLSFAVATEIVHLPSGGNFYSENSPLKGVEFVELKAMTAKEEDIMINDSYIEQGIVFDKLIDSLLITPGVKSTDFIDCDKVALLTAARKTGYGDELTVIHNCRECGHSGEATVSLSKMLDKAKTEKFTIKDGDDWTFDENSRTLSFQLPVTELNVSIRILNNEDFAYLVKSKEQKQKLSLPHSDTIEFLRRVLVSANGETDPGDLSKLTEVLPSADARKIKIVHNTNIPVFDTKQEVTCSECSATAEKEVPFSVGWFWSN